MRVDKPDMGVLIMTHNDCYTKGRRMTPGGIVVHSSGVNNPYLKRYVGPDDGILGHNPNGNHWNRPGLDKCASAMIGRADSGAVMIYQTLPWDWRPWLCGKGSKGTYNDTHIQFEMLEDGLTNEAYWREVRAKAVHLCAWLCQEYGIEVSNVVGHYEAAKAGYANNHADPQNWMGRFGDSMDLFREDIALMLYGGERPPQHYLGTVKTRYDGYINVRTEPHALGTIVGQLRDGTVVEVTDDNVVGTYAPIRYVADDPAVAGPFYVDTQYLVDRVDAEEGPEEPEPPGEVTYIVEITGYRGGPLAGVQAMNLADELRGAGYDVEVVGVNG